MNNTALTLVLVRMTPLALLSAEGKRSSKYFPDSASMASSRAAVMRKHYNRVFYRVLGIKHGSHRLRVPDCIGILPTYPWRYACTADGCKAVWLDGSETRETCHDGFNGSKAGPTVLERSGRL